MQLSEAKFAVNAAPDEVWRFIRDIESLCACIPGVEHVKLLDGSTAELTVKEKVGVVPLIVNLTARIDAEEPPRRLHATATAEHLTMEIDVLLQAIGPGTELLGLIKVKGEGPLKPVVDRLFERRAAERAAQFADTLAKRFGAVSPEGAAPAPGFARWIRALLGRVWRR
jgi:carbon monoxide dehydrogenase subunit G